MSAKTVGVFAGRTIGVIAATAWKSTCIIAEAAGDAGEGFLEGAESGWDDRCAKMDIAIEARRVANAQKAQALLLKLEAARAAAGIATV